MNTIKDDNGIVVAHPGKQHSFETAVGLLEAGVLQQYITTVYNSKKSIAMRFCKIFLNKNDTKKAETRYCAELPEEFISQKCELLGLVGLVLLRLPGNKNVYRSYMVWLNDVFGKAVAKYAIRHNAAAVIMYDTTATECFKYLKQKAPHIKRILDMSIATREFAKNIYERDIEISKSDLIRRENEYIWNKKYLDIYREEIQDADFFLSSSEFVKSSIRYFGIPEEKIIVAPYGVNSEKFTTNGIKMKSEESAPLHLLFVGQVNARKGMHHLLKVMSQLNKDDVTLTLVGPVDKSAELYKKYNSVENIHFVGYKVRDELIQLYCSADVFVLPSLCEGMAMVGFEAMSMELPIICTTNTGINDLINDYVNGIVVEASNEDELKRAIQWCINHRKEVQKMGVAAKQSVKDYTWKHYRKQMASEVKRCVYKE